jgi:hypothetical protein
MSFDTAGFGWHATIFVGRWRLLVAGFTVIAAAIVILKTFYGFFLWQPGQSQKHTPADLGAVSNAYESWFCRPRPDSRVRTTQSALTWGLGTLLRKPKPH